MHLVIIIVGIVICEAIAQYHIKLYNEIPEKYYYLMGLGFYGIIVYLLNEAYNKTTMSPETKKSGKSLYRKKKRKFN